MVVSSPFPFVSAFGCVSLQGVVPSGLVVICYCTLLGFHCVHWHSFNNGSTCSQLHWMLSRCIPCWFTSILPLVRSLVHGRSACFIMKLAPHFCVICALPSTVNATDRFNDQYASALLLPLTVGFLDALVHVVCLFGEVVVVVDQS
jgi:hypothetical protein